MTASGDTVVQVSLLKELGYVLAMETVVGALSYAASLDQWYGPVIAGGFDLFMGYGGYENASYKELEVQRIGYYLICAGFVAKSLYNFHFGKKHDRKVRFWANFIGNNLLIFSGYFLDTLK